jgi:hypothetical protein
MKKLVLALVFGLLSLYTSHADYDLAIVDISPSSVEQSGSSDVKVRIYNYGSSISSYTVNWVVTTPDKTNASLANSKSFSTEIDQYDYQDLTVGSHDFTKDENYLIIAEVVLEFPFEDSNTDNDKYWQSGNYPESDAVAFVIDHPSPINTNSGDYYFTVKNNGPNQLSNVVMRWLWQDSDQSYLIDENDTTDAQFIEKYRDWQYSYVIIDPPLDSGDIRQINFGSFSSDDINDVLLMDTHRPNGRDDAGSNDTARCWMGSSLWGQYSIGDSSGIVSQFPSFKDAISYLYSKGIEEYDVDNPVYGIAGVQFYALPGTYQGSLELSGNATNQSNSNTVSFASMVDDSSQVVINGDNNYVFKTENVQHFAFKGCSFVLNEPGNVLYFGDNTGDFVVNSSMLYGYDTSSTSADYAVVKNSGSLDSCNVQGCSILEGSYGVYYTGSASDSIMTAGATINTFYGQTNAAVSMQYVANPFVNYNVVIDNRIEILNSSEAQLDYNRVYIEELSTDKAGRAYSSAPMSALGLFDCSSKSVVIGNNVCIKANDVIGCHLKSTNYSSSSDQSVVNENSIQGLAKGLYLEDCDNIVVSNNSIDLVGGKDASESALYINDNCSSIQLVRSVFSSTGGGYAVILGADDVVSLEIMNDYYSTGTVFARNEDSGDFSDLDTWRTHNNWVTQNVSKNVDPEYYEDCDLIACNSELSWGYELCNVTDAPLHFYPDDESDDHNLDLTFYWSELDTAEAYWLQVSTAPEFQQIVESKHDNVLGEDRTLIFDQQGIDNPNQTVYGLKENTTYYWRVKVHVTDKRSDWSETFKFTTGDVIISVDDFETSASSDLMIMPSIVENGQEYKIALKSYRNENVLINIYDQLGNVVYAENEQVGSGNILNLRCPESLSSGLYYVVVKSDKKNLLGKLIVN